MKIRKPLSFLLTLVMVLSLMPLTVFADGNSHKVLIGSELPLIHGRIFFHVGYGNSNTDEAWFRDLPACGVERSICEGEYAVLGWEPDPGFQLYRGYAAYLPDHSDRIYFFDNWSEGGEEIYAPEGIGDYEIEINACFTAIPLSVDISDNIRGGSVTTKSITRNGEVTNNYNMYKQPGGVSFPDDKAAVGDTVTLTATPDNGYRLKSLSVKYYDVVVPTTPGDNEGEYTFTMPANSVTVVAEFEEIVYSIGVNSNCPDSVILNKQTAAEGEKVYFSLDENYCSDTITIEDANGTELELDHDDDGIFFIMPASDVTMNVEFYNIQAWSSYISLSKNIAEPGEDVTVILSLPENYEPDSLYYEVNKKVGEPDRYDIQLQEGVTSYTFEMPSLSDAYPPVCVYVTYHYVFPTMQVSYIDENNDEQTVTARILTGSEPSVYNYGADIHLGTPGQETWYVVPDNVVYASSTYNGFSPRFVADGPVNIILCDNKSLTGVGCLKDGTFKIYGQASGTGTASVDKINNMGLSIYGGSLTTVSAESIDSITIDGGSLNVTGGDSPATTVVQGNITLSAGSLTFGGHSNQLVCFGTFTMTGGNLDVVGSIEAREGIYLGWTEITDRVSIGYVEGATLTSDFTDGTEIYEKNKTISGYSWNLTPVEQVDSEPKFKGHQLVLSGQIGMYFYMSIPEGMTDGAMTFTVGDRTVTADGTLQSDGRYKFTCYVNSVEMAEEITATYTYTADGESKTVTDTTSVKEYLEVIINNEKGLAEYTAATPLAKSIYNYGYYAMQAVPGGSKHPAMPDTYTGEVTLITSLDGYAISATLDTDVITKASYSLDLESETAINFYLTTDSELSKDNVSVTAPSGTTFNYTVEKVGSRYRVQITGIGAHELGTEFALRTGNTTISASAMTYVRQRLANANASEVTKNAAAALYAYYQEAINYRNSNN